MDMSARLERRMYHHDA